MRTYDLIAELPLTVEGYGLSGLSQDVSAGFTRRTTLISIFGAGEVGTGEDVNYQGDEHEAFQRGGLVGVPPPGVYTLDTFSRQLDTPALFADPPAYPASYDYRRSAVESAALDLALRQAGRSLPDVLGLVPQPLRFVCSLGLGTPPSLDPIVRRLAIDPGMRFKLDPSPDWSVDFIRQLVELDAIDTIDFKAHYSQDTPVERPHVDAYAALANAFSDAWIEDPAVTSDALAVLAPYSDRVTWDAPIHGVADIESRPWLPRMVNVKPSRFGPLSTLLDTLDWLAAHGIGSYAGGQFELGVGRGQVQAIASLFHADAPNDIAPVVWNVPEPPPDAPKTPLAPALLEVGFGWTPTG